MAPNIDFTDARLSTILSGLEGPEGPPPAVSPALNLVLYPLSVPFRRPEADPEDDPEIRQFVMANDQRGPLFDSIGGFVCSDDGKLWACIAKDPDSHSGEWLLVNHEKKGEPRHGRPFVSRDGSAFACQQTIRDEKTGFTQSQILGAGTEGPMFQAVEPAGFSARGLFAYKAFDGARFYVFAEGNRIGPYADVQELQWSPDGRRLAYVAAEALSPERFAVIDGQKGPPATNVARLRFSADGMRAAYIATTKEGCRVVADGKPGSLYRHVQQLWFSGDALSVVSHVRLDGGWAIAVDDRPGVAYDEVGPPVFNRNATIVAYAARRGAKSFAVVGGVESEPCDVVYRLVVGETSGAAYALMQGKTCVLVHNGHEVRKGPSRPNHLAISADGASIAFSESHDGKVRIVSDGEPGEAFTAVDRLTFAPDGRTVVYTAHDGDQGFVVVGKRRHGPMTPYTEPVFSPSGDAVAVVARIGREIWRKAIPVRG